MPAARRNGVTTASGDAFFNEVTFTGSVADASGLLYMNARYYNPATAWFLSQDSYTGSASDPWTQHLYAYCNNNPVNMVDPTGHVPVRRTPLMTYLDDGDEGNDYSKVLEETKEDYYLIGSKHRTFREYSDMRNYSDEEIHRMARDKSLPPDVRQKARDTEKKIAQQTKKRKQVRF